MRILVVCQMLFIRQLITLVGNLELGKLMWFVLKDLDIRFL